MGKRRGSFFDEFFFTLCSRDLASVGAHRRLVLRRECGQLERGEGVATVTNVLEDVLPTGALATMKKKHEIKLCLKETGGK